VPQLDYRVVDVLGTPKITTTGEFRFNCPFCVKGDTKYHLYVHPERGWFCQREQVGGTIRNLHRRLGIPYEDTALLEKSPGFDVSRFLEYNTNSTIREGGTIGGEGSPPVLPEDLTRVNFLEEEYLYLLGRGIRRERIEERGIYKGSKVKWKKENGEEVEKDLRGRVIFISWGENKEVKYWTGRLVNYHYARARAYVKNYREPKYFSAPGGDRINHLYQDNAVNPKHCFLVEGPISAMAVGLDAVSTFGIPTEKQLFLLAEKTREITVSLDGDALEKSIWAAQVLYSLGASVYILPLPKGEDPASLGEDFFRELAEDRVKFDPLNLLEVYERADIIGAKHKRRKGGGDEKV